MYASDFDGVISKEVMPDELFIVTSSEESQNLAVEIEELLLRSNSATTKLLLEIFEELRILLWRNRLEGVGEAVFRARLSFSLWYSTVDEELSRVSISIIDSDSTAADANVKTNCEVSRLERHLRSVLS
jgi:hypothetical protein